MPLDFYHVIDLPDGTRTPGKIDHRDQPQFLGLHQASLSGLRVLDIATLDGFWAFWAERQGAEHVLAIDVDRYENYDWGYHGPGKNITALAHQDKAAVFRHLKQKLGSQVVKETLSVYELTPARHGIFDLVFFYGLLYHLRHPLLALDRVRAVCRGAVIIETHIVRSMSQLPMMLFYEDDVLARAATNWCGPSEACVVHWLKSAGFSDIFAEREGSQKRPDRQRFIGTVDPYWAELFRSNQNFFCCDEAYFRASRKEIEQVLSNQFS
jgi:tRNA (mo5U34)-methyltransferase